MSTACRGGGLLRVGASAPCQGQHQPEQGCGDKPRLLRHHARWAAGQWHIISQLHTVLDLLWRYMRSQAA